MAANHPKGEELGKAPQWEGRSAIALEHIALSLEAIEGHMVQISAALGGQNTVRELVLAVHNVRKAIAEHK
jgi:hypothetical protein